LPNPREVREIVGAVMKGFTHSVHRRSSDVPSRSRCKQILVVDDLEDNAESMAMLLRQHGHDVHTALSGPSAVRAARLRPPEVVLLDISMPGMSGFEVAAELRRMFGPRVLIIAITACGSEDDGQFVSAGFDDYFIKPADPSEVERIVNGSAEG
jgi:CheY-like chemotaxis protein